MKKVNKTIVELMQRIQKVRGMDILIIALFSAMLTFCIFIIQPTPLFGTVKKLLMRPKVFALNFLPIFGLNMVLYALLPKLSWSVKLTSLLTLMLAIVNRTKILYRDEPLGFFDLTLGVEAMTMTFKSKYTPDLSAIFFALLVMILVFVFFHYYKNRTFKLQYRAITVILVLLCAFYLYHEIYTKDRVYNALEVDGLYYSDRDNYNSKGLLFCLIRNSSLVHIRIPKNYDANEFKNIEQKHDVNAQLSQIETSKLPNVVMIMGEAFDDISDLEIFEVQEGRDPIANFKKIKEEALISGRLVTPTIAGGTADTEFEVISGCMTDRVAPNRSYSYNGVNQDMNTVLRSFQRAGYFTRGFHPGYGWFYKRQSVYPRLGFEESFFLDSIEEPIIKGEYLDEDYTYDIFIERLDESVKSRREPVLDFMVTIQNHGPYFKDKYEEDFEIPTNKPISKEMSECLACYFQGIADMDRNLKRIHDYMKKSEEPFILVYWGDHLPGLLDSVDRYSELDYKISNESFEEEIKYFSTPFVIWANDAAKANSDYEKIAKEIANSVKTPEELKHIKVIDSYESLMSSHYLGGALLEILGMDKIDPYYSFLNEIRGKFPVLSRYFIYDGKAAYKKLEYRGELLEELEKYYRWQYYRITNKFNSKK